MAKLTIPIAQKHERLDCPVIASNVAGVQEQLGDALLVDPRNPVEIAGAIKPLIETPGLCCALIERGRARASNWTGHNFVRGVFSVLDEFESVHRCWDG